MSLDTQQYTQSKGNIKCRTSLRRLRCNLVIFYISTVSIYYTSTIIKFSYIKIKSKKVGDRSAVQLQTLSVFHNRIPISHHNRCVEFELNYKPQLVYEKEKHFPLNNLSTRILQSMYNVYYEVFICLLYCNLFYYQY